MTVRPDSAGLAADPMATDTRLLDADPAIGDWRFCVAPMLDWH